MLNRLLYWLSGALRVRFIKLEETPYLERYWLGSLFGVTAYLHRFVSGDDERHVHDHPWGWSFALVLAGGYLEERLVGMCPNYGWLSTHRRMFPGRVNVITGRDFHRITAPKPGTWTLFVHGPRIKSWGFLNRLEAIRSIYYLQPYDVTSTFGWHLTAPRGRDVMRAPITPRRPRHATADAAV